MTDISLGKPVRQKERHELRKANFFSQTAAENSQRVDDSVNTIERVKDEIKFIQSILLAEHGEDV